MKLTLFSWNLFDASVWRSGTYITIDMIYNHGASLIKLFMKAFFKKEAHFKGRSKKFFKQIIFLKVFFQKRILYENMSWELILKIHVHQNKIVLAKGFHKAGTLRFRNFVTHFPPLCAHRLLPYTQTHTHTHTHARARALAYGYYFLKKIWQRYILWININQRTTNSVKETTIQSYRNQNTKDLWDWLFFNEPAKKKFLHKICIWKSFLTDS